jgi:hypothetical protein
MAVARQLPMAVHSPRCHTPPRLHTPHPRHQLPPRPWPPQVLDLYHVHPLLVEEMAQLSGLSRLQELSIAASELDLARLPPSLTTLEVRLLEYAIGHG